MVVVPEIVTRLRQKKQKKKNKEKLVKDLNIYIYIYILHLPCLYFKCTVKSVQNQTFQHWQGC